MLSYYSNVSILRKNLSLLINNKVIIVDNTDDVSKKVISILPQNEAAHVTILEQSKNTGYAEGMNIGMNKAFEYTNEWVVLLNDDMELSKEAIEELTNQLPLKKPGIYGPYAGNLDPNRWSTILRSSLLPPDYVSGSCMIIHKEVFEKIHGFYNGYFMYYEDVEYCIRAKRNKFPVEKLKLSNINHQDGASISKGSPLHTYYLARNHFVFVMRQAPLYIKLHELIRLPKSLKEQKGTSGFRGIIDGLMLRMGPVARLRKS